MEQARTGSATAGSPAALSVSGIDVSLGGLHVLKDVSLEVAQGEFLCVIGPNGAGKTTFLNVLSGLIKPRDGAIRLLGTPVTGWSPDRLVRHGLGRTFQSASVFPGLTVFENVRLAAQAAGLSRIWPWSTTGSLRECNDAATAILERVGLAALGEREAKALSHGEKRKLELAMAVVARPRVLLLDEPAAGVNVGDLPALEELIASLRDEKGMAIVMIEHHMDMVLSLADNVAVLDHGELIAHGSPDQVVGDPRVRSAYLGTL